MADIRINNLPNEPIPNPSEFLAIDGASTRKATIQLVVNAGAPVASQSQAEAGVDNNARMTALSTKQSIDFNSVPLSRSVTADSGLTGGGSLASDISIALSSTSLTSLGLANTAVQPSRQVIAGTGLSGGGPLSADVTLNLSASTQTSLGLANTAIQDGSNALVPNGGTSGQVLVKNSNTNRDTGWATIAAATAVSYAPQSLNSAQQAQARSNISASLTGDSFGLTLTNNSSDVANDIDISAGEAASTETNPVLMVLSTTITKRLDAAWAVGSGNGGLDTGTVGNSTYYIWLIQRLDTGVVDALFSLSSTAPTMPANYTAKRVIGYVQRSGGVNSAPISLLGNIKLQPVQTLSGTAFDITGIPVGVNRVNVIILTMTTSASTTPILQVGSGAIVTTGYTSDAGGITSASAAQSNTSTSSHLLAYSAGPSFSISGVTTLTRMAGNIWMINSVLRTLSGGTVMVNTYISLSGPLDRVRLTTGVGTATIGGTASISWEF